MIKTEYLKKIKKIAEKKIYNASFIFEIEPMEKALKNVRNATYYDAEEFTQNGANNKQPEYASFSNAQGIELYKAFSYLSPLEQVTTIIHEFIHAYQSYANMGGIKNDGHDGIFMGLVRNVLKVGYPNYFTLEGSTASHTVGGLRYLLNNVPIIDEWYGLQCPRCKKIFGTSVYNGIICPNCGYEVNL